MPTKAHIIAEIKRTAAENNGVALGRQRFETVTGIRYAEWCGVHWARWSEAVKEAGFEPNSISMPIETDVLLHRLASLALELRRIPTGPDLRMKRRSDATFPSSGVFERLGGKADWMKMLAVFCADKPEFSDVAAYFDAYVPPRTWKKEDNADPKTEVEFGYVYLLKHGSRREYKIGSTNNKLRREGELKIELPEKGEPIHVIETDDPTGVEAYWHRRFDAKRLNGEWFALSPDDVKAFKRWRRIV